MYTPTEDPPKGEIVSFNVPKIICETNKAYIPISVVVRTDTLLNPEHYCWVACYEHLGWGAGDRVWQGYDWFDTSGTIVFSVSLFDGSYFVVAGLSNGLSYDTTFSYAYTPLTPVTAGTEACSTWRTFELDYYRQGDLDALPKGLSDVQQSYDSAYISLSVYTVPSIFMKQRILFNADSIMSYVLDRIDQGLGYHHHLFAIVGFKDIWGNPYLTIDGVTVTPQPPAEYHWATLICVENAFNYFRPSDSLEAVSSVTAHELGHLIARLTDACGEAPDSHVVGQCIMEGLDYDQQSLDLVLSCNQPLQTWPYRDTFCDSCIIRLRGSPF